MKTVTIDIPEEVYESVERTAKKLPVSVAELIDQILRRRCTERETEVLKPLFQATPRSVLDHPPISGGMILKPLEPRAERTDEFFDHRETDDRS